MDSPLSWTGRQLAAFWAGVVTLVVLLLLECAWRAPSWEVAVAASPSSAGERIAAMLETLRQLPIEITIVALVLLAALVTSVAWTAAHASRRVAQQIT